MISQASRTTIRAHAARRAHRRPGRRKDDAPGSASRARLRDGAGDRSGNHRGPSKPGAGPAPVAARVRAGNPAPGHRQVPLGMLATTASSSSTGASSKRWAWSTKSSRFPNANSARCSPCIRTIARSSPCPPGKPSTGTTLRATSRSTRQRAFIGKRRGGIVDADTRSSKSPGCRYPSGASMSSTGLAAAAPDPSVAAEAQRRASEIPCSSLENVTAATSHSSSIGAETLPGFRPAHAAVVLRQARRRLDVEPGTRLAVTVRDAALVSKYAFGTRTATFHVIPVTSSTGQKLVTAANLSTTDQECVSSRVITLTVLIIPIFQRQLSTRGRQ